MSYQDRLKSISDKKRLLIEEEKKIVDVRKAEIARLAERCGVLEVEDALIAGALLFIKNIDGEHKDLIERLQKHGERFLRPSKKSKENKKNPPENQPAGATLQADEIVRT